MTTYGKPRDKVSPYARAGPISSRPSSNPSQNAASQPNSDVSLKKKHYRARGCRGGASRKGRKKQMSHRELHYDREAQENLDPAPNTLLPTSGFTPKDVNTMDDQGIKKAFAPSHSHTNLLPHQHSYTANAKVNQGYKKVTFAPYQTHHIASEKHSYSHFIDSSKEGPKRHKLMHSFSGRQNTPTPNPQVETAVSLKESQGIPDFMIHGSKRAISPAIRTTKESPARSPGGFSFFSISPRSYLTGTTTKSQKLH